MNAELIKNIEIIVRGPTGCGKSEVLEVIYNALLDFYNNSKPDFKIAGKDPRGGIEDAKITGQTARKRDIIFFLKEENISGQLKIHK